MELGELMLFVGWNLSAPILLYTGGDPEDNIITINKHKLSNIF